MSWDDFKSTPESTKVKNPLVRSTNFNHYYAIFRIGKSYKTINGSVACTLNQIRGFQKHMERETNVLNADTKITNEILIGDKDIYGTVKEYIKDIKLRKDGVIAKELLFTASPDFFKGLAPGELELWKADNMKYLKDTFGENCIYATCHNDEKTPHIHALIVPRFWNEKRNVYVLANKRYFGGVGKFREYQDNYAEAIQTRFKCLHRGIKYSKAKHVTIRQFYTLIKQEYNEKNLSQTIAKAKNSELLEIKIKAIQRTLEVYKNYNSKNDIDKQAAISESKNLIKEIEKMKDDKEMYKQALSLISQSYKVPQYVIDQAVKMCENINEKEK